jgi:signal transduction histidine kinase
VVERAPDRQRHDEILADIARVAGSSLELEPVLERIAQRAAELTGADRASILLLDRAGMTLLPSALYGMDPEFTTGWKTRPVALRDEPLSREAVSTQRPVVVLDAAQDPRTDKASVAFFGDKSILVAPLVSRGHVLGTLFLNHLRQPYAFSADDVETTSAIAGQAAIAIHNARLYRDARRLAAQLRASFGYAGEALASADNVQHTLQMMVQLAVETVGASGGSIALLDETGRSTYLVGATGPPLPPSARNDEAAEFPLATAERPLGVLQLWRAHLPFTEDERDLLASFASHARAAIEHARLYASLQVERERARQAERAQAEFTSMISHELRTPLALIKGYASTLLRPNLALPPATARRFVEGIDKATERLRKLIDNLLTATTLEAGIITPPEPATLDVADLLERAVAEASLVTGDRRCTLSVDGEAHVVLGDADQLTQVIENLVHNALKYAPGETPVTVKLSQEGARVVIAVRDFGPGIPPAALRLIFEKFYRVPAGEGAAEETRRPSGMGLGLYICRRIVEAHGGEIWAENIAEGGAAFFVALPAVLQSPGRRFQEGHANPGRGSKEHSEDGPPSDPVAVPEAGGQ